MEQNPDISIITINYNNTNDTIELLKSLRKSSLRNFEIIVVDNGSKIDNGQELKSMFAEVKYIRSEINLGFAGGNNLGVKNSKGRYLFFLNNDTLISSNTLSVLLRKAIEHPEVAVCTPKIIYLKENAIQYAGSKSINPYTGRGVRIGHGEKDISKYSESYYTDLAHGAAMFVPRKVVHEVGIMPEIYFLYYEELDWCEQFKRYGYKILYVGETCIWHKESASVSKTAGLKHYYMHRNRILFMRRNYKGIKSAVNLFFYLFISLPKNFIASINSADNLKAYLLALLWNIKHTNEGKPIFKS